MAVDEPCRICHQSSRDPEQVRVRGATRDVEHESYTVWRCRHCGTLNALEPVDYDRIYANYPVQRQRDDFFSQRLLAKRLKILVAAGLLHEHSVLDYGCGSGLFVRYLVDKGYQCRGYDPYNQQHCDPGVLARRYDVVTCQGVIEHVDEPFELLARLADQVAPGGRLIVGTPYSDNVDIHDVIDQLGVLHQPFHRFVLSRKQAETFFRLPGWDLERVIDACYVDTAFPFANTMFLFHLFKSGGGLMDFAFEPIPASHFLRHPGLIFWGLFGRLFARRQDLFAVMVRQPSTGGMANSAATFDTVD